ncbi:outer membrane transport energization protein TonB [Halopseudomonas xinjiangensis]|uniref:Protein TonB n=1 Tax=Halopseudomonas xinjiangensis TaxID=487184 RepID=A0A1H1WMT7_9GAMM|nr:energy transducer TonB [Halopseudomonas xinjiangensis]SDS98483.1 outer membrane transport energization protein TonB [Halopseudomonas xinjiangensis]
MRLLVSLGAAVLVALALFGLMILLVMPPRDDQLPDEEIARVGFVRSVSDTASEERQRRELPERPEPPDLPEPPPIPDAAPEAPAQAEVALDLSIPDLPAQINITAAPSLDNLAVAQPTPEPVAAPAAPAPQPAEPEAAASAEMGEVSIDEDVTPLVDIPPNYPPRASAAGIEGKVVLRFTITAEGKVDNLRVTEAEPPGVFDREARRAASRWRFAPRRENGQPVPREATKTLYFRLQGRRR